jgi:single-stranded-DNA-specific exonuclease
VDRLSLTGRSWRIRTGAECSAAPELQGSALVSTLQAARGLQEPQGTLPEPPDLLRACERVRRALACGERVGIFGDYDCDGITASAQMVRYFRRHSTDALVRLPHRLHDGYGLSRAIVNELRTQGIGLLITVDTGITAIEPIRNLQAHGTDVIVIDHHHARAEVPPAHALLHPALTPGFPEPHPSGAGMVLLFLTALEEGAWEDMETDKALAMIGTVADLVELRGVNRTIVRSGLRALETVQSGPLKDLRDTALGRGVLTSSDIAFRIAPRINAAGRMDDPMIALHALLHGGAALERLHQLNRARQELTESLVESALSAIDRNADFLATASPDYPPGIVGLIAGTLTEATGRPSLAAAVHNGYCTASLRSTPAYHITQGLERIAGLLDAFGGHAQAAGCTFREEHFAEIVEMLQCDVRKRVPPDHLQPITIIDAQTPAESVTLELAAMLDELEPFGQGNPEPRFLLRNVLFTSVRVVGNDGKHLQARIANRKAIGFRLGHLHRHCSRRLDAVCRIGTDTWNGKREVQLFIDDIREAVGRPAATRITE